MSTSARQQCCVALTGRCYEIQGTPPFIPFVEIIEHYARVAPFEVLRETLGDAAPEVARLVPDLRRLFPDMPPPLELPPQQQRHYLFKNVAEFLERVSRVSSIVLLLDDLQWADAATLLLLQHLAPLLGQLPVLALDLPGRRAGREPAVRRDARDVEPQAVGRSGSTSGVYRRRVLPGCWRRLVGRRHRRHS